MEKNKFTHGSLFSGIGGPEIAAEIMVLPEMLSSMVSSRYLLSGRCKGRKQKF